MISLPRELKDMIEFEQETPYLKEGASQEQQKVFDAFLARLRNSTEITENETSVVITNH